MRHKTMTARFRLLLAGLLIGSADLLQGQQASGKTIKVKLLLPRPDAKRPSYAATKVYVDGKEVDGQGLRPESDRHDAQG